VRGSSQQGSVRATGHDGAVASCPRWDRHLRRREQRSDGRQSQPL